MTLTDIGFATNTSGRLEVYSNTDSSQEGTQIAIPYLIHPIGFDADILSQTSAEWDMDIRLDPWVGGGVTGMEVDVGWIADPSGVPYYGAIDHGIRIFFGGAGPRIVYYASGHSPTTVSLSGDFSNTIRVKLMLLAHRMVIRLYTPGGPQFYYKSLSHTTDVAGSLPTISTGARSGLYTPSVLVYSKLKYSVGVSDGESELRHIQRDDTLNRKNASSQQKTIRTFGAYR